MPITPTQIANQVEKLNRVASDPSFLQLLEQLQTTEPRERSRFVATKMSPRALTRQGIPLPEGMRITTRYFEEPKAPVLKAKRIGLPERIGARPSVEPLAASICVSIGVVVCVSVGG